MAMKDPPHPGEIVRHEILEPLNITVTDAAKNLGVTRPALSNVLNGRSSLTSEMALRIEKAYGPKMDHLMKMQLAYEISQTRSREKSIKVKRHASVHD